MEKFPFVAEAPKTSEAEPAAEFTLEQQEEIQRKLRMLSSLAYFIGKDFRIPIELNQPGAGWHWDFKANKIRVDPKDLLEKPMDELRYLFCHEAGHRRVSRMDFISLEQWREPGFPVLMNFIEDPRSDNFVAESYPKYAELIDIAWNEFFASKEKMEKQAMEKLGFMPRHVQAGYEYIRQWLKERQGESVEIDSELPEDVKAVVKKTLESARDSWWRYPTRQEADKSQELISQYAKASYEINRDEIWPEYKKLLEADKKEMDQEVQEHAKSLPRDRAKQAMEMAQKVFVEFEKALNEELEGGLVVDPEREEEIRKTAEDRRQTAGEGERDDELKKATIAGGETVRKGEFPLEPLDMVGLLKYKERLKREMNKDKNVYEKYRREVLPLIDQLESELRQVFVERKSTAWKSGYRTGKRIDIKKRIQEKAKSVPAMESQAWQKREKPVEKDYAITILNDLSGSMRGEKIKEDFKAKIVLTEVLNKLGVSVEVLGFNDDIYEYQKFGQDLTAEIREHMGGMFKEVDDSCCKACGHEHNETDLGWAAHMAAERLKKEKAENKFLITLSDGILQESDKHSRSDFDLGNVVVNVVKDTDIKLIGLGVGRGSRGLADYFPNSLTEVDAKDMAVKLAGLIKDAIVDNEKL